VEWRFNGRVVERYTNATHIPTKRCSSASTPEAGIAKTWRLVPPSTRRSSLSPTALSSSRLHYLSYDWNLPAHLGTHTAEPGSKWHACRMGDGPHQLNRALTLLRRRRPFLCVLGSASATLPAGPAAVWAWGAQWLSTCGRRLRRLARAKLPRWGVLGVLWVEHIPSRAPIFPAFSSLFS